MAAAKATAKLTVKLTANFERNLDEIELFLIEAGASQAFDALIDELSDTVIPNLESFPAMGRSFLSRPIRSVEVSNSIDALQGKLLKLGEDVEIREYVLQHDLVLYTYDGLLVHLLSICHHKQLSFDFRRLWSGGQV